MAQASAQFSPAQVLAAGQRAEADGRFDDAVRFFAHLLENHADSLEAVKAREAMSRIALARLNGSAKPPHPEEPPPPTRRLAELPLPSPADPADLSDLNLADTHLGNPHVDSHVDEVEVTQWAERLSAHRVTGPSDDAAVRVAAGTAGAAVPGAAVGSDYDADTEAATSVAVSTTPRLEVPESNPAFLLGRAIAGAVTVAGAAAAMIALFLAIATAVELEIAAPIAEGFANSELGKFGLPTVIFAGLLVCLVGQLLSAVFSIANDSRDRAMLRRAELEFWQDEK